MNYFYCSAIDNAIKANQVGAVRLLINYITKYQNHYSSSYMFMKNLPDIFLLDIEILPLLDS